MKHVKLFEQFLNENLSLDFSFSDAVETAMDDTYTPNEEEVFYDELKYIGAKNGNDAILVFDDNDDIEFIDNHENEISKFKESSVEGSEIWGTIGGTNTGMGMLGGIKTFFMNDGTSTFYYINKKDVKKFLKKFGSEIE
tara:strand:- start:14607 stop:15023 length:417 start_codon:yes stop_codon:yes gene_type:complete